MGSRVSPTTTCLYFPQAQSLKGEKYLKHATGPPALAELKQAGELLPNQTLLINMLPLLEAKDRSEIENIVTTSDKLVQLFT